MQRWLVLFLLAAACEEPFFAFGTDSLFHLPPGATAFGSDCSALSRSATDQYACVQPLMRRVVDLAHERHLRVAMGFEFGVLPPEYFSLTDGASDFYWRGEANMIPNPTNPLAIKLLYTTIDNLLEAYPTIDWVWLWLNEHSFGAARTSCRRSCSASTARCPPTLPSPA